MKNNGAKTGKPGYRYVRIYEDIKGRIERNEYRINDFLPSETALSEVYGVERATIRRSLELLAGEGIIRKIAGVGSKINGVAAPEETGATADTVSAVGNNIAFILPADSPDKITQPFTASVFYNFENECKKHKYNLLYTNLDSGDSLPDNVTNRGIKGIVWVSRVSPELVATAQKMNIPSVMISHSLPDIMSVNCDNVGGSCLAVEHLLGLGHREIAYINGISTYTNAIERYEGFVRKMNQGGAPINPELMTEGDWGFNSGVECMNALLDKRRQHRFTAVYSANDMMALGAVKAITAAGLSVPEDIAVVGFDDIEQCRYSTPSLTTVGVDIELFVRYIMKKLNEVMDDISAPPVKTVIPVRLHVRESTGIFRSETRP